MNQIVLEQYINQGLSVRKIAQNLGTNYSKIRRDIEQLGLSTRFLPRGEISHRCLTCGENDPHNFYGKRKSACKKCFIKQDAEIGRSKKLRAISIFGGGCLHCGYNDYYGSLDFHHLDPSQKEDWKSFRNWGWKRLEAELTKCILLCSNCHRKEHARLRGEFDPNTTSFVGSRKKLLA